MQKAFVGRRTVSEDESLGQFLGRTQVVTPLSSGNERNWAQRHAVLIASEAIAAARR